MTRDAPKIEVTFEGRFGALKRVIRTIRTKFDHEFPENIWILTRDRTPSSRTMRRAFKSLGMLGLHDKDRSVQTCYRNPGSVIVRFEENAVDFGAGNTVLKALAAVLLDPKSTRKTELFMGFNRSGRNPNLRPRLRRLPYQTSSPAQTLLTPPPSSGSE